MNAFLGQHVRFIAHWGQAISAAVVVLVALSLYLLLRRYRFFLPRSWGSATLCVVLVPIGLVASLVCLRVTQVKPRVLTLLGRLDALEGKPAPPLAFEQVTTGRAGTLEDYRGQVVLVNLWATWCPPCLEEMPELDNLARGLADQGFTVLAVSDEEPDVLTRYADKHPTSILLGRIDEFDWVDMGGERPISFLIDRHGIVRNIYTGPWDEAFFRSEVLPVL